MLGRVSGWKKTEIVSKSASLWMSEFFSGFGRMVLTNVRVEEI